MDPHYESAHKSQTVNQATIIFQAIGRYVTTMFCSGNYDSICIEIPTLGTFLRNAQR